MIIGRTVEFVTVPTSNRRCCLRASIAEVVVRVFVVDHNSAKLIERVAEQLRIGLFRNEANAVAVDVAFVRVAPLGTLLHIVNLCARRKTAVKPLQSKESTRSKRG